MPRVEVVRREIEIAIAIAIAMGEFVKETDATGTEYSYIQVGAPLENDVYEFVTYDGFVKKQGN